ncbi:MAG: cupin domain-containing protein [Lachnospiraceae bacterium]|nr:cupin domain-containing protein [Lachnospiraceae bacterium]
MEACMKKVNLLDAVNTVEGLYRYKKVADMNGNVLSVVQVENRVLNFHVHEKSDELFFVIDGAFELETKEGLTELHEGELAVVPKNTLHRPVVKNLTKFLMVELAGTLNKENSGVFYEEENVSDRRNSYHSIVNASFGF